MLWESHRAGYDSARSFTGDGYSHHRYGLPDRICEAVRADPTSLAHRPEFAPIDGYILQKWIHTPLSEEALRSLEGLWYPAEMDQDPALPALTTQLEAALTEPGAFATWSLRAFEYEGAHQATDLELFVLDLARCELVVVQHNT